LEHDEEEWRGKLRPGDLEGARPTRPAAGVDRAAESRRGGEEARDDFGRPRPGRRAASVAQLSKHEHVLVGRTIISFPTAGSGHACEKGNTGNHLRFLSIRRPSQEPFKRINAIVVIIRENFEGVVQIRAIPAAEKRAQHLWTTNARLHKPMRLEAFEHR